MAQDNGIYIIAGGNQQIWAIDPKTKQRLRIKLAKYRIKVFDVYASGSGIYHASELITLEQKKVDGHTKHFQVNYAQVVDSISEKPCVTITPPGVDGMPLEQRLVPIEFQFLKIGDSLLYTLNGSKELYSLIVMQKLNNLEELTLMVKTSISEIKELPL